MPQSTRRVQFAHFLLHKVREASFRISELLSVCQASRRRFVAREPQADGDGRLVNFHFSAFASLVQTIKDILPVVADQKVSWSDFSSVRHMQFMHAIRNALTHDGNPVINLWVDGRYYVASDFVRLDQNRQPVRVQAPLEDIQTLVIEFTIDLCSYLRSAISPLLDSEALAGPLYGVEFFENAIKHPAIPAFAQMLFAEEDRSAAEMAGSNPVAEVISELDALLGICRSNSKSARSCT